MSEIVNNILNKLTTLLGDECEKLKGVEQQLRFLKDELSAMEALLEQLALRDELDLSAKDWRDHVRDMAYDMEDCIDDFMHSLGGANANAGFIEKTTQLLKTLWARHQFTKQIEELKARAIEANDGRKRYKIDDSSSGYNFVDVDPRIPALYKEAASLVGIDGPREELVKLLTDPNEEVKVVSIVGLGGLGKTTLAKQVYDKIGEQFNCKAFLSVSQRPDMAGLLTGLQTKLGIGPSRSHEVQDIISKLREHLTPNRACFLYLGMYPEDSEIKRDDLARQWVAQGLVSSSRGPNLEDVAKSYFNELINVSMIQPERIEYGEVLSCKVHDMILDSILIKCVEDNFLSVAYNYEDMARLRLRGCKYKVRRLSLSSRAGGIADGTISVTTATSMSQVRSLAFFGEPEHMTPCLVLMKYLRVLVIESHDKDVDLRAISQLFHLKYLKYTAYRVHLPTEIGGLVHLETLEAYTSYLEDMPSEVVQLPRLSRLIVRTPLPKGIKNMKSLCSLHGFCLRMSSLEDIIGLGELTNLRDLSFSGSSPETTHADALVSSIGKLRKLRYLCSCNWFEDEDNRMGLLSDPPLHLKVLELKHWYIPRVPRWTGDLHCLSHLTLLVGEISSEEVHVLGALPSLAHLHLDARRISTTGSASILGTGSFPVLEFLCFKITDGDVTAVLACEAGAMPKLRSLIVYIDEQRWGHSAPVGMEHLLSLERIHVNLHCILGQPFEPLTTRAESVFRNAMQVLPSPPSVTVTFQGGRILDQPEGSN